MNYNCFHMRSAHLFSAKVLNNHSSCSFLARQRGIKQGLVSRVSPSCLPIVSRLSPACVPIIARTFSPRRRKKPLRSKEGTPRKVVMTLASKSRPESGLDCLMCSMFALQNLASTILFVPNSLDSGQAKAGQGADPEASGSTKLRQVRQPRPDAGLGLQVEVIATF